VAASMSISESTYADVILSWLKPCEDLTDTIKVIRNVVAKNPMVLECLKHHKKTTDRCS